MTALRVDEVGPATSVQDRGRFGAQRFGLGTAGAMDRLGLASAAVLAGLPSDAAAIELGPFGARFTAIDGPVRVALAGAPRGATAAGRPFAAGETALLQPGEALALRAAKGGVFSYLAVEGGIAGEPAFGSMAVHARAGLGSPVPRPLQAGDVLPVGDAAAGAPERSLPAMRLAEGPIRVVLGPQDDYFDADAIATFLAAEWRISMTSDRMGFRLEGPRIPHARGFNIVSDGIANGHVQIPGNGQPLVLLADRGTTGGYPKIACIISADLGRFAQIPAGSTLRFARVDMKEAQAEARRLAAAIAALPGAVRAVLGGSAEALLSANLAGHAVSATDPASWLDTAAP